MNPSKKNCFHLFRHALLAISTSLPMVWSHAATPTEVLAAYTAQTGAAASVSNGQRLFTTQQGGTWSCASCHGAKPTRTTQHAATGKPIQALAPAFNPEQLTAPTKVEKWLRRNCKDVFSRECRPDEKADVLAWLISLKP
jgi:hypothetical protein